MSNQRCKREVIARKSAKELWRTTWQSLSLEGLVFIALMGVMIGPGESADYELPMFAADSDEQIGTYKIDEQDYERLVKYKYLPTRTTFLTDVELARKLDLNLPQLADIKSALDRNDSVALEHALAAYLNTRLVPFKVPHQDFVSQSDQYRRDAEPWLGEELTVKVNDIDRKYTLGERTNWYDFRSEGGLNFFAWCWGGPLSNVYLATGDEKYVKRFLTYAYSFYKNARPPAERPTLWSGGMGPWSGGDGGGRTHSGYVPWQYRAIGGSPTLTDADRVMFLKMFYEHGEFMHLFSEKHLAHNFELHLIKGLLNMTLTFPEFSDSKLWRERCVERLTQNIHDTVLLDGGSYERHTYHFAYLAPYVDAFKKLRDAGYPMPESFRSAMEPMFDWGMWLLSPLMQYPSLNISGFDDLTGYMQPAIEVYPERTDLTYVATGGTKGKPPERTDKVLPYTGFLTMRSDWSKDALYMAMNYNGSPAQSSDSFPQLLSFGVWAHGRAYMTNSGQPVSYAHPLSKTWCRHTRSSNTVLIDRKSQETVTDGGRLENWQSLPHKASEGLGFNYLVAVSDAYRKLAVSHRRAVLFVKPKYWLIYDLLNPPDNSTQPHEYRWQGHFQPTELTVDSLTKTVSTGVEDGKRLYVLPVKPESLELEQGNGVIATPSGRADGPYIRLMQKSDKGVSFTVLLYPAINNSKPPVFEKLEVKKGNQSVPDEESVGCRVIYDKNEDLLALATSGELRSYGELMTDGESAYIRREDGKIVEAGLVGGSQLSYKGKMILKVGQDILSVYIRYAGDTVYADVRGSGKISVAGGSAKGVVLNGQVVSADANEGQLNVESPGAGVLTLTTPVFSTDPSELWKVLVGNPPPQEVKFNSFALVSWQTQVPSDAMIEYAPSGGDRWIKNLNPEPTTDHWMAMSNLTPDETYKLRITCRSDDGRFVRRETTYTFKEVVQNE